MIDFKTGVTVKGAAADKLETVAEMLAVPAVNAVTKPPVETLATVALDDDQLAAAVTSFIEPSEYAAEALSCSVAPAANEMAPDGAKETETTETVGCVVLFPLLLLPLPPHPRRIRKKKQIVEQAFCTLCPGEDRFGPKS